jgi:hypothetical protein
MSENQVTLQALEVRSQHFVFPRRELLQKLASAVLLFFVPRPHLFSFCQAPKPEFWFGDVVDFWWNDEITGVRHSETGEIVGVVWNDADKIWEYMVTWLSSTAYPQSNYPIFDGELVTAGVICRH